MSDEIIYLSSSDSEEDQKIIIQKNNMNLNQHSNNSIKKNNFLGNKRINSNNNNISIINSINNKKSIIDNNSNNNKTNGLKNSNTTNKILYTNSQNYLNTNMSNNINTIINLNRNIINSNNYSFNQNNNNKIRIKKDLINEKVNEENYEKYTLENLKKRFLIFKKSLRNKKPKDISEKKIDANLPMFRQIFKNADFWTFVQDIPFKPKYNPKITKSPINKSLTDFENNINNEICKFRIVIFKRIKHFSVIGYISKSTGDKKIILIRKETVNNDKIESFYIKEYIGNVINKSVNDYNSLNSFLNEIHKEIANDSYSKKINK